MDKHHLDNLKRSTILLVEDNAELRSKFRDILYLYVDDIIEASNGEEAFELYQRKNPNIIITDVHMPIMDGLLLTTLVRKLNNDIPIVIISAFSEKNILMDFISLNLVEYLVKPASLEELMRALERCSKIILEKGLIETNLTENTCYSFSKKSLAVDKKLVSLSPKEIELLELLIRNKNKLVSKDLIEEQIYVNDEMTEPALNNLVSKIRKKIGSKIIKTIPNFGFMLVKEQ